MEIISVLSVSLFISSVGTLVYGDARAGSRCVRRAVGWRTPGCHSITDYSGTVHYL